jgi:hypothetical protein
VALTTLATLLLELSLTRIFSVVFYYHFAFLAISIALFGLGAGGVFSYVVSGWKGRFYRKLGMLSALNCLLVVLAAVIVLSQKATVTNGALALIYFTNALPFFCAGAIVSMVISETIERVNRVYFFDLIGAAGGCLLRRHFVCRGGVYLVLSGWVYARPRGQRWAGPAVDVADHREPEGALD